jgi:hypothetical protein
MAEMIKILFLAAQPNDAGRLRLDEEYHDIDRMLRGGTRRDSFQLVSQFAVRPDELQEALLRHEPHIVHFAGHGTDSEEVVLVDDSGASRPVSKNALARLFEILKDNVRIVLMNACYSKPQAEAISSTVDYAIGTSKSVGDRAAIAFSAGFYQALSFGRSVSEAFELGKNNMELLRHPGSDAPALLLREGVDPAEPFLQQRERMRPDYVDDLRSALDRLVMGTASEDDARGLRRAATAGRMILKPDAVTDGGHDAARPRLRIKPYRSLLEIKTEAETFRSLMERLYPAPQEGVAPPLPDNIFVGRDEALRDIRSLLGANGEPPTEKAVTVVRGWPGVGKTTLASFISRDREVQQAFPDGVLWTSLFFGENEVSKTEQEHKLLSLMAGWGRALGTDALLRVPTLEEVTAELAVMLRDKRMLLVVDDAWHQGHAAPFLQAGGSRCGVLVTTRLPEVARALTGAHRGSVYNLPVLSEDFALRLLRILAPAIVERHEEECRGLVRDLEYLPLSLHVAAGLLKKEDELGLDVNDLIEGLREDRALIKESAPLNRSEKGTTPTLAALLHRSTDSLDEQTRECFAFLGAFAPKPATFDLKAMAAVWGVDDPRPIVRELAGHGLIEPLGNGRFQMHALLVQHARSLLDV